jgi:hypothetical protein
MKIHCNNAERGPGSTSRWSQSNKCKFMELNDRIPSKPSISLAQLIAQELGPLSTSSTRSIRTTASVREHLDKEDRLEEDSSKIPTSICNADKPSIQYLTDRPVRSKTMSQQKSDPKTIPTVSKGGESTLTLNTTCKEQITSKSPWPSKPPPPMLPWSQISSKTPTAAPQMRNRINATLEYAGGNNPISPNHSVTSDDKDVSVHHSLASYGKGSSSSTNQPLSKSSPRSVLESDSLLLGSSPWPATLWASLREGGNSSHSMKNSRTVVSNHGASATRSWGDVPDTRFPTAIPSGRNNKGKQKSKSSKKSQPLNSSNRERKKNRKAKATSSAFDVLFNAAFPQEVCRQHSTKSNSSGLSSSQHSRQRSREWSNSVISTSRSLQHVDTMSSLSTTQSYISQECTSRKVSSEDPRLLSLLVTIDAAMITATHGRSRASRSQSYFRSLGDDRHDAITRSLKRSGRSAAFPKGRNRGVEKEYLVSTSLRTTKKKKEEPKSFKDTESINPSTQANESREDETRCQQSHTTTLETLMTAFPHEVRRRHSGKSHVGLYTSNRSRQRSLSRRKSTRSVVTPSLLQDQDADYTLTPCTRSLSCFLSKRERAGPAPRGLLDQQVF